jgi:16S rRNA (cytidine1402-2'-O)-methyltransferase
VSDAGTPALSDPGYELVQAALERGHRVVPVPGPSAVMAALVASGLPTDAFVYLGFLPRKDAERRRLLESVRAEPRTLVAFESPHRLLEALEAIRAVLGDRRLAVARELTKLHEEIFRGTASEAHDHFSRKDVLGEVTLVVAGAAAPPAEAWDDARVRAEMGRLVAGGLKRREAARQVAERAGRSARDVYNLTPEN